MANDTPASLAPAHVTAGAAANGGGEAGGARPAGGASRVPAPRAASAPSSPWEDDSSPLAPVVRALEAVEATPVRFFQRAGVSDIDISNATRNLLRGPAYESIKAAFREPEAPTATPNGTALGLVFNDELASNMLPRLLMLNCIPGFFRQNPFINHRRHAHTYAAVITARYYKDKEIHTAHEGVVHRARRLHGPVEFAQCVIVWARYILRQLLAIMETADPAGGVWRSAAALTENVVSAVPYFYDKYLRKWGKWVHEKSSEDGTVRTGRDVWVVLFCPRGAIDPRQITDATCRPAYEVHLPNSGPARNPVDERAVMRGPAPAQRPNRPPIAI